MWQGISRVDMIIATTTPADTGVEEVGEVGRKQEAEAGQDGFPWLAAQSPQCEGIKKK